MPDHEGPFTPPDPGRIHVLDPAEVRYWCDELGCTSDALQDAVGQAGEHVSAVREHLSRRRP